MQTAPAPHSRRQDLLLSLGIAVLAAMVHLGALRNGYAGDDVAVVSDNPLVHAFPRGLPALLSGGYWPFSGQLYRPLTLFSLALDWWVAGGAPGWTHAVNVALHAAVTVLVFTLLRALRATPRVAAAGAAIFAVHPVHVEVVATVVGRSELLATLFALIACNLYARRWGTPAARMAVVSALYLLALLAKEGAATLPGLLLLIELFQERELPVAERFRRMVPLGSAMAAALAAFLALRVWAIGAVLGTPVAPYLEGISTSSRIATAIRLWPEYLRLLLWPADLSFEWAPATIPVTTFADPAVWTALVLGVAVAALCVLDWRRHRGWMALGMAWVALTLLPVSQLFFPIGTLLAERTLYLPSVGLVLLVPRFAEMLAGTRPAWRPAAITVILALGAARTWTRIPAWRSSDTIRRDLMLRHPESWRVQWYIGTAAAERGDARGAAAAFDQALLLTGSNHDDVNVDAARFLLRMYRPGAAEPLLRRVVAHGDPGGSASTLLTAALLQQGRNGEALAVADGLPRAAARNPDLPVWSDHYAALALDASGERSAALARNTRGLARRSAAVRGQLWMHRARLWKLAGAADSMRAATDSARTYFTSMPPGFDQFPNPGSLLYAGVGGPLAPAPPGS